LYAAALFRSSNAPPRADKACIFAGRAPLILRSILAARTALYTAPFWHGAPGRESLPAATDYLQPIVNIADFTSEATHKIRQILEPIGSVCVAITGHKISTLACSFGHVGDCPPSLLAFASSLQIEGPVKNEAR